MEENLIKVLWIEDDPLVTGAYPEEAYEYGIHLVPFSCWDEAKEELNKNYDQWEAIVLDARCKIHKTDRDNAVRFLGYVLAELNGLTHEREKQIPWYVLSGGDEKEISDSITEHRLEWDADWPKSYYSKNKDREMLFKRIRVHCLIRPQEIQVKTVFFKDVFDALKQCGLDEDAENCLLNLLCPLVFNDLDNKDYNNRMYECRLMLEYFFRAMVGQGMVPESFHSVAKGKDTINSSWSSMLLAGEVLPPRANVTVLSPVFPKILANNVKTMIFATGSQLHTQPASYLSGMDVSEYIDELNGSVNLIKSFALQLCDMVLWYRHYIQNHTVEQNRRNWAYIDNNNV